MNIVFQPPNRFIGIGICHPAGFIEVPEATFMRYMPAAFISPICMPDICMSSCPVAADEGVELVCACSGKNTPPTRKRKMAEYGNTLTPDEKSGRTTATLVHTGLKG